MLDHDDVRRVLAADRAAELAAAFEAKPRRPLRLRLGLWLVRPYVVPAPPLTAARAR